MVLETLLNRLNFNFNVHAGHDLKSTFIVRPISTAEVSNLLRTLAPLVEQTQVAVYLRDAGPRPFAGLAGTAETVTIDLRHLKGISINQEKTIININVGETWSSVQHELERHGLAILGGKFACLRSPLITNALPDKSPFNYSGKGSAWASTVGFEVVLASGSILHASEADNTAIYETIQARLNESLIITCLHVRAFKSANLSGSITHYVPESFSLLAEAVVLFTKSESAGDRRVMFSAGYGFGRRLNTCCCFQARDMENHAEFLPFASLPGRVQEQSPVQTSSNLAICDDLAYDREPVSRYDISCHFLTVR